MSRSHLRSLAAFALKAAISAGLIAFALRGVDAATVLEQLRAVDAGAVLGAIAVVLAISLAQARRWEVVLARMEHPLPYREALRLVYVGVFFNQTLPSTVGGDAYRAWGAYKNGIHAGNAIASVLVDRILALVVLIGMIGAGAPWLLDFVRAPAARSALWLTLLAGAAGLVTLLVLARFAPLLQRWKLTRLLLRLSLGARAVVANARACFEMVLHTVVSHAAISFSVWVLARGLGIPLSLWHALLLVPLVTLITVLPISIAGWGLRESAMVHALGLIGVTSVQAFSLSVLFGLVVMASGIPGGVLWLAARRERAEMPVIPAESPGIR